MRKARKPAVRKPAVRNVVPNRLDIRDRPYMPGVRVAPPATLNRETPVSPFMLYNMARRYDEFRGFKADEGSSCRGALKAWYRHGACGSTRWTTHGGFDDDKATQKSVIEFIHGKV